MNLYIQSLFIAIPIFSVLIILEAIYAKIKKIKINHSADIISSLSSGMTNTIKDAIRFSFTIISYSWFVNHLTILKLEPLWISIIVAFIIQDFCGYWVHRLSHRINFLWNRHIIHHSSEEFNLSCALRQPISEIFKFFTFLWLPAAFLGIPAEVFAFIAPIHLFMQFWYHTKLINKMGVLEYILVTPSHHRVHHAINEEYLDKNFSQIFIIWDKLFGTFQKELDKVMPVYGTLRPAKTWNPMIINFKHMAQLIKDAWYAEIFSDKLKIWFMPTGWRPENVISSHTIHCIKNPYEQVKYKTNNSPLLLLWVWIQFIIAGILMVHLFIIIQNHSSTMYYLYATFIFIHIFSFTATLDHKMYAVISDLSKLTLGLIILYLQGYSWFGINQIFSIILVSYFILSIITTFYFCRLGINNKLKLG